MINKKKVKISYFNIYIFTNNISYLQQRPIPIKLIDTILRPSSFTLWSGEDHKQCTMICKAHFVKHTYSSLNNRIKYCQKGEDEKRKISFFIFLSENAFRDIKINIFLFLQLKKKQVICPTENNFCVLMIKDNIQVYFF